MWIKRTHEANCALAHTALRVSLKSKNAVYKWSTPLTDEARCVSLQSHAHPAHTSSPSRLSNVRAAHSSSRCEEKSCRPSAALQCEQKSCSSASSTAQPWHESA